MSATNRDHFIGAWVLSAYIFNTSGIKFAEDLFPGEHPNYLTEKANRWGHSPVRAIAFLEDSHFRRLTEIALERFGGRAAQRADYAGLVEGS